MFTVSFQIIKFCLYHCRRNKTGQIELIVQVCSSNKILPTTIEFNSMSPIWHHLLHFSSWSSYTHEKYELLYNWLKTVEVISFPPHSRDKLGGNLLQNWKWWICFNQSNKLHNYYNGKLVTQLAKVHWHLLYYLNLTWQGMIQRPTRAWSTCLTIFKGQVHNSCTDPY